MKNLWEEDDFCKIFAFLEEKKLPFFSGMGIPTERRTRTGQRSRTKGQSGERANCQFMVYMLPQCCLATPSIADFMVASQGFYLVDFD